MGVEDHPVHERTKITDDYKYGCQTRKRAIGYWVQVRQYHGDRYEMVSQFIFNNNTKLCRYVQHPEDRACRDCPQEKDVSWINQKRMELGLGC